MNRCPENDNIIEYLSGELDAESAAAMKLHMSNCPECSETARLWSGFKKGLAEEYEACRSEAFVSQVMTRIIPVVKKTWHESVYDFFVLWKAQIIAVAFAMTLVLVQRTYIPLQSAQLSNSTETTTGACELLSTKECSFEELLGVSGEIG